jgi:hypothetical protein
MRRRIVIAGHHHHRAAALPEQVREEIVILRRRALRGIGRIEDVSGDHQGIDGELADAVQQEGQEPRMFLRARMFAQHLAQVPVRRVQDAVSAGDFGRDNRFV